MKKKFKLPKKVKEDWVTALQSGLFQQGRGQLKDATGELFCCLGVARECKLAQNTKCQDNKKDFVSTIFLPMDIQKKLANFNDGLDDNCNDIKPWSFNKIANWIERNL